MKLSLVSLLITILALTIFAGCAETPTATPMPTPTGTSIQATAVPTLVLTPTPTSFTFNQTGVFPYFCAIHPSMTAVITVVEP